MFYLWNSRNRLAIGSVVAVILLALLDNSSSPKPVDDKPVNDLIEDVDYAMETMDYMIGLKNGKSKVRGVVEKEKKLEEWYWSCRTRQPENVRETGWIENDGIHLFSAFFDDRPNSLFPHNHAIQVLAMSWENLENRTNVYCSISSDKGATVVKGYVREIWQRAWDPRNLFYIPSLISCPLPSRLSSSKIMNVFLSTTPCRSQQDALAVIFPKELDAIKAVAVCVKGLDFQRDISKELVEWLEANFLFGADKVTIYSYSVSRKTKKILNFYEKRGKVEQISLSLPGNSPNLDPVRSAYIWRNRQQKRRHELIPYNDCLYRHLRSHKYILIIDTDEIVVPLKHFSYEKMLEELEKEKNRAISSIVVRNVFKFPSNETGKSNLFLLKNNKRSRKTSDVGEYGKSFSKIENIVTVFNHFALHRLSSKVISSIHLPEATAVKLHYKRNCPIESRNECYELEQDTVIDTSLEKYEEELTKRVEKVNREIGE